MAAGGRELHDLARRCRQVGDKALINRMRKGLVAATREAGPAVREAFREAMPKRGGYADVLADDLQFKTSVRTGGSTAKVELVVFADGVKERRDVPSLNRGRLRHPVWGRSRRLANGRRRQNPWADTQVPARSFDKAIDQTVDVVLAEMRKVQDEIAAAIVGR